MAGSCRIGLLTYPTLCCKGIQVSTKIMILPSGTLFQHVDLENFIISSWHVNHFEVLSTYRVAFTLYCAENRVWTSSSVEWTFGITNCAKSLIFYWYFMLH